MKGFLLVLFFCLFVLGYYFSFFRGSFSQGKVLVEVVMDFRYSDLVWGWKGI